MFFVSNIHIYIILFTKSVEIIERILFYTFSM